MPTASVLGDPPVNPARAQDDFIDFLFREATKPTPTHSENPGSAKKGSTALPSSRATKNAQSRSAKADATIKQHRMESSPQKSEGQRSCAEDSHDPQLEQGHGGNPHAEDPQQTQRTPLSSYDDEGDPDIADPFRHQSMSSGSLNLNGGPPGTQLDEHYFRGNQLN